MALNPKQSRFVDEYLVDLNATQAAIRAGYAATNADVTGPRLLTNRHVAAAVAIAQSARAVRTGITQARVLQELELLAFSDLAHYTVDDATGNVQLSRDAPAAAIRALQSIKRKVTVRGRGANREVTREVELRLWDKPGPLKLAGQHAGVKGFADRHEHTGKNGKPIEVVKRVVFGGRHKKEKKADG